MPLESILNHFKALIQSFHYSNQNSHSNEPVKYAKPCNKTNLKTTKMSYSEELWPDLEVIVKRRDTVWDLCGKLSSAELGVCRVRRSFELQESQRLRSSLRIWFIIKMNHTGSTFQTVLKPSF